MNLTPLQKERLNAFRLKVPVGIRHALVLLERANGNLAIAQEYFEDEMIHIISKKFGIDLTKATSYLIHNGFDIHKTLLHIEKETYSLSERILMRYKDKEEALSKLAYAIEKEYNITRDFWLNIQELQEQSNEVFCLLALEDWLSYSDWEGFDGALHFNFDIIINLLRDTLELPEIADILIAAQSIYDQQYDQQRKILKNQGYLFPTPEFLAQEKLYEDKFPELINTLYEFAKSNLDKFP